MSALQASTPAAGQDEVMAGVARLTGLLEREFEALKSRDLATLEQLQQEKKRFARGAGRCTRTLA